MRRAPEGRWRASHLRLGGLVSQQEIRQLSNDGGAKSTIGHIVSQAKDQDCSQCDPKEPADRNGRLAMAAATAQVRPDRTG